MLTWYVCKQRKRVSGFTATLPGCGNHVATGDIFTAVVVLRVPDSWGEKPSILFTSLTCCRSLLLRQSRDVAPPVWATRGGGNTGTCGCHRCGAHTRPCRVATPHPCVSQRARMAPTHLLYTTRHRCGARDCHPRSPCCRYLSLSNPMNSLDIMCFATLSSHGREKTTPPHSQEYQDIDPYDGPGVPPLGLGLGTWFWCFLVWRLVLVLSLVWER